MTNSPYNITLSSDSPTINYLPYRDGPTNGGWNMTCAQSDDSVYVPQTFCAGPTSRRSTFVGSSVYIDFQGTAAYLYGTGDAPSFSFQVDGQVRNDLISNPSSGLLAKVEGLGYGQHRVYVNVTQSNLISFSQAVLTIGVGQQNSIIRNHTVVPFTQTSSDGDPTLNPQFIYTGTWYTDVPGTIGITGDVIYPRQHTSETGAYVAFEVSQTSAFFIYGLVNVDLGPFSVTLTPPSDLGQPITNFYNSNSHYINLDRVMYWTSGLDRDKIYSVKITNMGQDDTPWWDFSHIDIIDGGFNSAGGSNQASKHHGVSVGVIAGAAAGGVVIVTLLILSWIWYQKRSRTKAVVTTRPKLDMLQESQVNVPFLLPPSTSPGASSYPHGLRGYSSAPTPQVQEATPGPPYLYDPLQQSTVHGNLSRPNLAPSNASTSPPQSPEGSSALSYTKSGLLMSWNGGEDPSGLSGQGMGAPAQVLREEDAGSLSSPGARVFRLPPDYKDSWSRDRPQ